MASGASIDLGTIYASVTLGLTQVQAGLDALKEQLGQAQGLVNDFVAALREAGIAADDATEPVAALDDALDTGAGAFQALATAAAEADGALSAVGGAVAEASASVDAASAEVEANTAALDDNTAAADANAAGHKKAGEASAGLGTSMGKLIAPAAIAEAAIVGIGAVSIKMAGDFEAATTQLVTGAGESQANLEMVRNGILQIAQQTGESTTQLAAGMFMIESSGLHGKAALDALSAAARGAAVGGAALADVGNAETTIMSDFSDQNVTAAQSVNSLIATVQNGKTTMSLLSQAIATVAPTAAAAHVHLADMMAALAAMTGEGVPAANAATYLRQTITALQAPSAQTAKALAAIGLNANAVAAGMQTNLPKTLEVITDALGKKFPDATKAVQAEMAKVTAGTETFDQAMQNLNNSGAAGYVAALKNIAGGSKQMQGILDLTGTHMGTFKSNLDSISSSVQQGGNSIKGWALVQQDFNTQLAQAGATAQVALIQVGTALEPIAKQVITNLMPALKQFGDWARTHGPEIAHAFEIAAAAIGVVLVVALAAATTTFIMANAAAIGIVSALALLTAGIAVVVTHWQQIISFIKSGNPIMVALEAAVAGVGASFLAFGISQIPALISAIPGVLASLGTMAAGWWADATAAGAAAIATLAAAAPFILVGAAVALLVVGIIELVRHWSQVKTFLENFAHTIGSFFSGLGSQVQAGLAAAGSAIGGWFSSLGTGAQHAVEAVGGWFSSLGTQVHNKLLALMGDVRALWNSIPLIFQAGLKAAELVVQNAVATVVGWFSWLYNHNYFFADLVNGIRAEFTLAQTIITTIWNAITGFLTRAWNGDVALARALWHDLTAGIQLEVTTAQAIISAVWTAVSTFVMGVLTTLTGWIRQEWALITTEAQLAWQLFQTSIVQPVQNTWNRVTALIGGWASWLQGKWNQIVGDVTAWWGQMTGKVEAGGKAAADKVTSSFITPITTAITGLISQALTWGENLMKMLGQGIANGAGGIKQAATNALGGLGRILGFHSPAAEGPGADADTWAPNLMTMFAAGLAASGPLLAQAAAHALLGVRAALTSGVTGAATISGGGTLAASATGPSAAGGVLRDVVAGIRLSSASVATSALSGPLAPSGANGGGDTYYLTVEVVASPSDGEPYQAGVAFGNGFASGFQQARTQRGL